MVDGKIVGSQVQEHKLILHDLIVEDMVVNKVIRVAVTINELSPS